MRLQYAFSALAVLGTAALFWSPKPPAPITSTREENGLEVQVTRHAAPHGFEKYQVPSLENPDSTHFQLPRSYLRSRLCEGDEAMLAAVQARLLVTPGEGAAFGELAAACPEKSAFCGRAASATVEDAGLSREELIFFATTLGACDLPRFTELRGDPRLPLGTRARAWRLMADAGVWSPALGALIDEHLAGDGGALRDSWTLAGALAQVTTESPGVLLASNRLMDANPMLAHLLGRSASSAVRAEVCKRLGCDAGVEAEPEDSGIDPREVLASCALQGDGQCLDRLALVDWEIARSVALRVESNAAWAPALRSFETHEAFVEFARPIAVSRAPDGGYTPDLLLGAWSSRGRLGRLAPGGLGHDELAADFATLAPELAGAFFAETGNDLGGVRLTGHLGDDQFALDVRRKPETHDGRAVLALLNAMLAERGGTKRFHLVASRVGPIARYAEPALISALVEKRLIELADPDDEGDED